MLLIVSGRSPSFEIVRAWAELTLKTSRLPNRRLVGENLIVGPVARASAAVKTTATNRIDPRSCFIRSTKPYPNMIMVLLRALHDPVGGDGAEPGGLGQ